MHIAERIRQINQCYVTGPLVWNSLQDYLRDPAVSMSIGAFYKHLQTFLFAVY